MSEATSEVVASRIPAESETEIERHARHNYWITMLEGGAFMAGTSFLNGQTLLPDMIRQLGGSPLLIALTPSLMMIGFWMAPVLTAHSVDSMHRYMPFVTMTGIIQRIPYLFAALALWYAATSGDGRLIALVAVAASPVISGIAGGMGAAAWQQLVARCIPETKRASLFAARYTIACIGGIVAGITTNILFRHFSMISTYAWLHLITFGLIATSFAIFIFTREPHTRKPETHSLTLVENLRLMARLIREDKIFARYLASRLFRNGTLVIAPFLAIYARDSLSRSEAFLGTLLIAQNVGAIVGNFGAARLGDRVGGKLVNQLALCVYVIAFAWTMLAGSSTEFMAIFFLMGVAGYAGEVGGFTLMLELLPERNRATYLSLTSLANIPGVFAAGWISSAVWKHTHSIALLAIITIVTLLASIALLHPIREPRTAASATL